MTVEGPESGMAQAQTTKASSRVFISYASQDTTVAGAVVEALERDGVACWIAPRDVRAGALYADAIVRAISDAEALVLVLSSSSIASAHVGKEVERASSKRRPLIALRIDDAPLSPALEYFLSESHWVDARAGGMDAALAKLIAAIREPDRTAPGIVPAATPATSAATVSARSPKSRRKRILLVAGTAVVTVALAALLADKFWPSTRGSAQRPGAAANYVVSEKSIAVLPFTDMSEKKDQEYFSDGLSEELIDMLTKIPDLRVPARTSSFYFKGKSEDIPTIARRLMVAHVLEGSVRKSGDHLRVTAQLIRADSGFHIWSETYDRQLDDVFKLQDEIATAVVSALKLKLAAMPSAKDRQTSNPDAYDQYLIGRQLLSGGNWEVDRSAAEAFQRAVDLDPNYALAWAGLAKASFWADLSAWGLTESTAEHIAALQNVRATADKAVALAPDLAAGYMTRGFTRSLGQYDYEGAGEDIRRALVLEPENSDALFTYADAVLMPTGRLDEAATAVEKALKSDPLNAVYWRLLGLLEVFRGDYRAARAALKRSLEINPLQSDTAAYVAYSFLLEGQPAIARRESERAAVEGYRQQGAALAEHDLGHATEAKQWLTDVIAKNGDAMSFQIAEIYAWWGDKDSAFQWLEKAHVVHDPGLTFAKSDPLLRSLRADPRYGAFLRTMKLSE